MVQESMKSSLLWSISGVGLVAGGVIALSYWSHGQTTASQDILAETTVVTATRGFSPTATVPWDRALEYGWEAAVATQTAATEAEWRRVGDLWLQAIAELERVPQDDLHRVEAQTKIQQYLANFDYAEAEKAKARTAVPSAVSSSPPQVNNRLNPEVLKAVLANGPMKIEFPNPQVPVTDPAARVVGKSAHASARVELIGAIDSLTQAKLVLPQAKGANQVSMADMVYINHFIESAVPAWSGQSGWLATSLGQIQTSPSQSLSQTWGAYEVAISTTNRGRKIVVTVSPTP